MRKDTQLQIRLTTAQKRLIEKQAHQAGSSVSEWVLNQLIATRGQPFQDCLAELQSDGDEQPIWAALHDLLENLRPGDFETSLPAPTVTLNARQANIVAAMVEYASRRKGISPPSWTVNIRPLDNPYFGSSLISLRPYLLVHAPVEFKRRNLFVDASIGERV
jgi:hypothetical protein